MEFLGRTIDTDKYDFECLSESTLETLEKLVDGGFYRPGPMEYRFVDPGEIFDNPGFLDFLPPTKLCMVTIDAESLLMSIASGVIMHASNKKSDTYNDGEDKKMYPGFTTITGKLAEMAMASVLQMSVEVGYSSKGDDGSDVITGLSIPTSHRFLRNHSRSQSAGKDIRPTELRIDVKSTYERYTTNCPKGISYIKRGRSDLNRIPLKSHIYASSMIRDGWGIFKEDLKTYPYITDEIAQGRPIRALLLGWQDSTTVINMPTKLSPKSNERDQWVNVEVEWRQLKPIEDLVTSLRNKSPEILFNGTPIVEYK